MTTAYRDSEISRDAIPFCRASSAPQQVTETAEMINPIHMIVSALTPILIVGEKSDHLSRYEQGEQHADRHYPGSQAERSPEDLPDTFLLTGTVVEADDRADTLDNSICR